MRDGVLFVAQAALLLLCAHGSSELFDSATEHEIHPLVSDLEDVVPLSAPKLGKDGTVAVAKEDAKETTKAKVTILGEAIKSGYPGPFAPPLPPSGPMAPATAFLTPPRKVLPLLQNLRHSCAATME